MNIRQIPISEVVSWDKNPRNIKTKDFERLKKQIKEFGVYKPMIAVQENGGYTVLGGNMRLRALRELGFKNVDISIVQAKSEAQKIRFALSDNDRAGEYDEQLLAELVYPYIEEISLEDYKVDLGEQVSLRTVCEALGPELTLLENEGLDKSNLGHEYCGNTLPFRLGKILAFIKDEKIKMKIEKLENELLGKNFQEINQAKINKVMTEILDRTL